MPRPTSLQVRSSSNPHGWCGRRRRRRLFAWVLGRISKRLLGRIPRKRLWQRQYASRLTQRQYASRVSQNQYTSRFSKSQYTSRPRQSQYPARSTPTSSKTATRTKTRTRTSSKTTPTPQPVSTLPWSRPGSSTQASPQAPLNQADCNVDCVCCYKTKNKLRRDDASPTSPPPTVSSPAIKREDGPARKAIRRGIPYEKKKKMPPKDPVKVSLLNGSKVDCSQFKPELLQRMDSLFAFYHKQWWCYRKLLNGYKFYNALFNGLALLLMAAGMIARPILNNSTFLGLFDGRGYRGQRMERVQEIVRQSGHVPFCLHHVRQSLDRIENLWTWHSL